MCQPSPSSDLPSLTRPRKHLNRGKPAVGSSSFGSTRGSPRPSPTTPFVKAGGLFRLNGLHHHPPRMNLTRCPPVAEGLCARQRRRPGKGVFAAAPLTCVRELARQLAGRLTCR